MSQFDSILSSMKAESFHAKKQLLEYTLHIVQNILKNQPTLKYLDKVAILNYAYSEVDDFQSAIASAETYKEKDLIFTCEDLLLGLIMTLCPKSEEISPENLAKIQRLVDTVAKERYIENALDDLFKQETIDEAEVGNLLSLVRQTDDEYQRGMLYSGLVHYKEDVAKISDAGKTLIAAHLVAEFKRYLSQEQLNEDCVNNLEVAVDICKYFANDELIAILGRVLELGYSNVNYYAIDSLLSVGQDVPADIIISLSKSLAYANLTYAMLGKFGKQNLFPQECATPEYLAKSDLVHWLMYPTELGQEPDEIEYIGKITYLFKKEVYFVFKYRSNSDTLDENLKNKWLIGWSSEDGGTFSNFDEYALFEKKSLNATLKNIKKKLIGS
jgi:hypothetical protein